MHHQTQGGDHALGLLALRKAGLEQRSAGKFHEQLDGTVGHRVRRLQLHRRHAHELLHRQTAAEKSQQHAHSLDVGLRVPAPPTRPARPEHARRFERPQHGRRHPAALGQLGKSQTLLGELGDGDRLVGPFRSTLDGLFDGPQRVAAILQVPDQTQPLEMTGAVPGGAALVTGLRQQALGLVGAQQLDGDARLPGQLLHPVLLHAALLVISNAHSSLNSYTA